VSADRSVRRPFILFNAIAEDIMRPAMFLLTALLLADMSVGVALASPHYVFVTSTSGPGDLGAWPEGQPETGLAAGDRVCRTRAAAAGLPGADEYVAWLSDGNDDAYCRVHGLAGKKFAWCGQAEFPANAGPWLRRDDQHAINDASVAFYGVPAHGVIRPILFDEFGTLLPADAVPFTGTGWTGTAREDDCGGWKSSEQSVFGSNGSSHAVAPTWSDWGAGHCSTPRPLICLRSGDGGPEWAPTTATTARVAFVTSASGTGNLSSWPEADGQTGLAAGDSICRNLARDAGLPHAQSFRAWLSSSTESAPLRFGSDRAWERLDGVEIAAGLSELIAGSIEVPIHLDETGEVPIGNGVWSGTAADGTAQLGANCSDWTEDSDGNALGGISTRSDADWTARTSVPTACASHQRLYCFSEHPFVFRSGFEVDPGN
jgi:hypothetical protein